MQLVSAQPAIATNASSGRPVTMRPQSTSRKAHPGSLKSANGAVVLETLQNGNGSGHLVLDSPTNSSSSSASTTTLLPLHAPTDVFVCPEESLFYSQCLEKLVLCRQNQPGTLVEFGTGDGSPVINCLLKAPFTGVIHGYELNGQAAAIATSRATQFGLQSKYKVHHSCFFKGVEQQKQCASSESLMLVANPPYIPAPDSDIMMPALHGGTDGAQLTRTLLSLGFDSTLLLISAYSNPIKTLRHAQQEGYIVADFMVTPLPFGTYSSEPKVKDWIWEMRARGEAFCSERTYLLAGVLFQKAGAPEVQAAGGSAVDLSDELIKVLTAF